MAERKKTKNFLILLVLMFLAILVITGFSGPQAAPDDTDSTATGKVKITITQQPVQTEDGTVKLKITETQNSAS